MGSKITMDPTFTVVTKTLLNMLTNIFLGEKHTKTKTKQRTKERRPYVQQDSKSLSLKHELLLIKVS